jgi:bacterioferritin B
MPAEQFVSELNEQIGREFGAHQQYLAVAVHYDRRSRSAATR